MTGGEDAGDGVFFYLIHSELAGRLTAWAELGDVRCGAKCEMTTLRDDFIRKGSREIIQRANALGMCRANDELERSVFRDKLEAFMILAFLNSAGGIDI